MHPLPRRQCGLLAVVASAAACGSGPSAIHDQRERGARPDSDAPGRAGEQASPRRGSGHEPVAASEYRSRGDDHPPDASQDSSAASSGTTHFTRVRKESRRGSVTLPAGHRARDLKGARQMTRWQNRGQRPTLRCATCERSTVHVKAGSRWVCVRCVLFDRLTWRRYRPRAAARRT